MGNLLENEDEKQMKEPKLNQEKLDIPKESKINEEIENKKEIEDKEKEKEKEKEQKEEPQEYESKEIEDESKEKKEESQEKEEVPKDLDEEEDEPKDIEDEEEEPKDLEEEHIETKEEMEEQAQPIIKVNQENNVEQEQNEEIQNGGMKTPTKGNLYRYIQGYDINQIYKVAPESHESSKEIQEINESYKLNQEKNNNVVNIIYHDIAFRSGQKKENNNKIEINNERIKKRSSNIRKEPKDSNPKVHILSRKKAYKKNNEEVKVNYELTDISKNEIGNKEYTMVIGDGM